MKKEFNIFVEETIKTQARWKTCWKTSPLTTPAKKTKIYGYLEALLFGSKSQKEQIKEVNRNYKNTQHWNLDAKYLEPLKGFLQKWL